MIYSNLISHYAPIQILLNLSQIYLIFLSSMKCTANSFFFQYFDVESKNMFLLSNIVKSI